MLTSSLSGLINALTYIEPVLCMIAIMMIWRARQTNAYRYVIAFLLTRILSTLMILPLLHPRLIHLTGPQAYYPLFYIYWISDAIEAVFLFCTIISIYRLAMEPLKGLQSMGMMMFRWAGAISIMVAITIALGPHLTAIRFITRAVTQLQQTQSVLILCMLLFVCIAIQPMGLSYRSRVFGVSMGLGFIATTDLVTSAFLSYHRMVSYVSICSSIALCITLLTWTVYFAIPEPKRRMIVLPTTSPFFRWNQISMALGDEPGFVAIGEVTTDMFAPAELEVMRRASGKMDSAVGF